MPRDDTVDASNKEMDEFDRELEDFKRFCFISGQAAIESTQGCLEGDPEGCDSEYTLGLAPHP